MKAAKHAEESGGTYNPEASKSATLGDKLKGFKV